MPIKRMGRAGLTGDLKNPGVSWYPLVMRGWIAALIVCSACGEQSRLVVDARTDLQPGAELTELRVELDDGRRESTSVRAGEDWLAGRRVADLRVGDGEYSLRMVGLDASGREIIVRNARVAVMNDTAVTLLLTRDCRGVLCNAADAEACFAGQCVSEECSEESLEACGDPECADASDCPGASACGTVQCESGACVYASTGACAANEYCDPEFGCRSTDEGPTDGLIAHYRVDDDPSDGVIDDSSGFERHGTCTECPAFRSGGPRASYYESSEDDHQVLIESDETINSSHRLYRRRVDSHPGREHVRRERSLPSRSDQGPPTHSSSP